jgi:hypothetical protein
MRNMRKMHVSYPLQHFREGGGREKLIKSLENLIFDDHELLGKERREAILHLIQEKGKQQPVFAHRNSGQHITRQRQQVHGVSITLPDEILEMWYDSEYRTIMLGSGCTPDLRMIRQFAPRPLTTHPDPTNPIRYKIIASPNQVKPLNPERSNAWLLMRIFLDLHGPERLCPSCGHVNGRILKDPPWLVAFATGHGDTVVQADWLALMPTTEISDDETL